MKKNPENEHSHPGLWTLMRDIAVLQVKLIVDGLRDLILVPASLIAGIVSIVKTKRGEPGHEFYTLVGVGKQSERWINLFGALENAPPEIIELNHFGDADMDEIVSRVESFVIAEYKRGGVTAGAKDRLEKAMEKMQRRRDRKP